MACGSPSSSTWGVQQNVVELDVTVDDEGLLRMQEGQSVSHLGAPFRPLRPAVHRLRVTAEQLRLSSDTDNDWERSVHILFSRSK